MLVSCLGERAGRADLTAASGSRFANPRVDGGREMPGLKSARRNALALPGKSCPWSFWGLPSLCRLREIQFVLAHGCLQHVFLDSAQALKRDAGETWQESSTGPNCRPFSIHLCWHETGGGLAAVFPAYARVGACICACGQVTLLPALKARWHLHIA